MSVLSTDHRDHNTHSPSYEHEPFSWSSKKSLTERIHNIYITFLLCIRSMFFTTNESDYISVWTKIPMGLFGFGKSLSILLIQYFEQSIISWWVIIDCSTNDWWISYMYSGTGSEFLSELVLMSLELVLILFLCLFVCQK